LAVVEPFFLSPNKFFDALKALIDCAVVPVQRHGHITIVLCHDIKHVFAKVLELSGVISRDRVNLHADMQQVTAVAYQ
jgi:hypothetical protein